MGTIVKIVEVGRVFILLQFLAWLWKSFLSHRSFESIWIAWVSRRYKLKLQEVEIPKEQYCRLREDICYDFLEETANRTSKEAATQSAEQIVQNWSRDSPERVTLVLLPNKNWMDRYASHMIIGDTAYVLNQSRIPFVKKFVFGLWESFGTNSTAIAQTETVKKPRHTLDEQLATYYLLTGRDTNGKPKTSSVCPRTLSLHIDAPCIQALTDAAMKPLDIPSLEWAYKRGIKVQILESKVGTPFLPSLWASRTGTAIYIKSPVIDPLAYRKPERFVRAVTRVYAHCHAALAEHLLVQALIHHAPPAGSSCPSR